MARISVIVPFRNAEHFLTHCLNGLLSQSYSPEKYEVLLVDNNSTDTSAEIRKLYPRLKVIREKAEGAYGARNTGLMQARGEIIAFTQVSGGCAATL